MKVRLTHNAIRLRLLRGEVAGVATGSDVTVAVALPGGVAWRVSLSPSTNDDVPTVIADASNLRIVVPTSLLASWADDRGRVGLDFTVAGGPTRVTIEKDFACLHGDAAQNVDTFDHPAAQGSTTT